MIKKFLFTIIALLFCVQTFAQSELGEYNRKVDARDFQNKCGSCHSIGLMTTSREVLPSEVWCLVKRMANYHGANLYCHEQNCHIYTYIVNSIAKSRSDEPEKALQCAPECRRISEQQALERAQARYR